LLGAGAALAGATGCSRGPQESIVPYVKQPPEVVPSVPSRYATVMALDGYGVGIVAESHEGRPTKLEGNPLHPASLGALGAIHQASLLDLYDPERAKRIAHEGAPVTWRAFADAIAATRAPAGKTHVLLGPASAPHLIEVVRRARARAEVAVHFDTPLSRRAAWEGAKLAFGRTLEPRWDFGRADVVVALDADFLAAASSPPSWAGAWASRRRLADPAGSMSRLYVVEARLTVTGMSADERLRVQTREVGGIAADLLAQLVALGGAPAGELRRAAASRAAGGHAAWLRALARDLRAHPGASLVIAGDGQPPVVHLLAHAMNELLGNVGRAVTYGASPVFEAGDATHGLEGLVRAIDGGAVSTLVVVGGDPVYTAAADLRFAEHLRGVPTTAYVGARETATARACAWTAPEAHWLEAWGDALAFDGMASIAQPLIGPLVDGRTAGQVLAAVAGEPDASSRELVEACWRPRMAGDFEASWRHALVHGVVAGTVLDAQDARVDWAPVARALSTPATPPAPLEIAYYADAKVHDGRFGDNAWLQELPDPVTKLTWDNAALVAPSTASRLGLDTEDVVVLEVRGRSVRAPVLVVPGMADDVVALALGYGQAAPDLLSSGVGANAYALRDSRAPWFDETTARRGEETWRLARTQEHGSMEGRPIVLRRTLDEYRRDPDFAKPQNERPRLLYELKPDAPHQWGMTIDLNACTGCSACVVACMAENNVSVVGKPGVRLGREMHWLRIDRYFVGDPREAAAVVQPMLCQHCENAPCEYVCPVNATVHSHDGLNEMVYNRCVGTRFCSNNCPYKVRRFNFFNYTVDKPDSVRLVMNPDVTVRARGVMEKCTYCVQRIREAEIVARREQRPIADGEIATACEQTCPTRAIVFGDVADPRTRVSRSRENGRLYEVLHELGTVPRTRYLARIVNPNPELHEG
jgi:molybdopterin-containing oxidoreductase family iron-sulfur binding subunit